MTAVAILPPEWAPQSGVLLTWPHADSDWAPLLEDAEHCFAEIAREISLRQRVLIACNDDATLHSAQARLSAPGARLDQVRFYTAPSNDSWARDHGPITVLRDSQAVLLDYRFNGWGGKYKHDRDDQITTRLHAHGAFGATPIESPGLVLEGGAIEVNGTGALLTTARCLRSSTRNPQLSQSDIEQRLKIQLGVQTFHWLQRGGLEGDDTDGHIDTLARFCSEDTIAYQSCDDAADSHHAELSAMALELQALRQMDGSPYRLHALPWPRAQYNDEGRRLPATYANFLIINGAVLMPTYNDPADALAKTVLRRCFPGREIVGIDCCALIRQFGSLHCVAMQLPAGVVT
ncbi:MAG: agmatine deiminase family protein [Nevskiales bacterium]